MDRPDSLEMEAQRKQAERQAWLEEKEARQKSHQRRGCLIGIFALILLAFILGGVVLLMNVAMPYDQTDQELIEVEIPEGAVVGDIAQLLEEEGVIRSAAIFNAYARLHGATTDMQAGTHALSPSMSMDAIITELRTGNSSINGKWTVAFPEGSTVEQMAEIIARETDHSAEDFLNLLTDPTFMAEMVAAYPDLLTTGYQGGQVRYIFEGYLFPATYEVSDEGGLETLVEQMLTKTQDVLSDYQDAIAASPYPLQDIMTMASLVEKEGVTEEDRKLIAGVFYNRLNIGMAIQSDISILYALNEHKEMVYYNELAVDSPYNLYQNLGLGPGPFNNPGEEAINAALNPTPTDALYFYANLKTGEVFFTSDYEEHLALQREYEETGTIQRP